MTRPPLRDPQQTATDLNAAADLLKQEGWTQGRFRNEDGCRCAVGAVVGAMGGVASPLSLPADAVISMRYADALSVLAEQVRRDYPSAVFDHGELITGWNDKADREAEQVTATMRAAAELAVTR